MTLVLTEAAYIPATAVGRPTHELRLHEALLSAAPRLLRNPTHEIVAVHEFTIRGSRPDVVIADADLGLFDRRAIAGLPPLTATAEVAVRAALRSTRVQREETVVDLAARYVAPTRASRAVARLVKAGYVTRSTGGLRIDPVCGVGLVRTAGFEAKTGNWRAAASQARRWRLMFDEASLVFPAGYAFRLERGVASLNQFGILGVENCGEIHRLGLPPARRADVFNVALVEEYFYARLIEERVALPTANAVSAEHPAFTRALAVA
jgi:hypothetical protein